MTNSQRLANVREYLTRWLSRMNPIDASGETPGENVADSDESGATDLLIESESILIRDGFYCGRRFQAERFNATWFMEEDELKIQQRDGGVSAVFIGDQIGDLSLLPEQVIAEPAPELPEIAAQVESEITTQIESEPETVIETTNDDQVDEPAKSMPLIALDPTKIDPTKIDPTKIVPDAEPEQTERPHVVSISTPIEKHAAAAEKTDSAPQEDHVESTSSPAAKSDRDDAGPQLPITKAA